MKLKSNERLILEQLQMNSRLTASEISRKLNIARSTVNIIISRLEENVIDTFTVTLKEDISGTFVNCYVMITSNPKVYTVDEELIKIPEIKELKSVAGAVDMVANIHAENNQELDKLLVKIARLDGIIKTETLIILTQKFSR